jgi:hypothetical protein
MVLYILLHWTTKPIGHKDNIGNQLMTLHFIVLFAVHSLTGVVDVAPRPSYGRVECVFFPPRSRAHPRETHLIIRSPSSFTAPSMVEFTANAVAATPETIWRTCIESMKWESWDPDLREVRDISGTGLCVEGTTCIFCMKDGQDLAIKLTNVIINESVDFNGSFMNGLLRAEGKVRIMPNANADSSLSSTSQIKYSFELLGVVGMLAMMFKKNEVVDGTRVGLDNMVRMSAEAQRGK